MFCSGFVAGVLPDDLDAVGDDGALVGGHAADDEELLLALARVEPVAGPHLDLGRARGLPSTAIAERRRAVRGELLAGQKAGGGRREAELEGLVGLHAERLLDARRGARRRCHHRAEAGVLVRNLAGKRDLLCLGDCGCEEQCSRTDERQRYPDLRGASAAHLNSCLKVHAAS